MTEAAALARLQNGREDAIAYFIDKYTAYVCTVIRCIIGSSMTEADVEEVASDVFLELWKQADRVTRPAVRAWLGSVARNKAKQKLRERGMTLSLDEDLIAIDGADLSERLERAERERLVRAAVFAMEPTDRAIFLRYYFHGQPITAISEETGIPVSTVKSRLRRGREKLRSALENA
ncbi:MAG: sigma-70 family RNA polymerase sigma factor [Oscillospiraceae bacterium]|nr:sigma-70 family RNA polymerase sigma factor [Oscillospiraceae bacterium]